MKEKTIRIFWPRTRPAPHLQVAAGKGNLKFCSPQKALPSDPSDTDSPFASPAECHFECRMLCVCSPCSFVRAASIGNFACNIRHWVEPRGDWPGVLQLALLALGRMVPGSTSHTGLPFPHSALYCRLLHLSTSSFSFPLFLSLSLPLFLLFSCSLPPSVSPSLLERPERRGVAAQRLAEVASRTEQARQSGEGWK